MAQVKSFAVKVRFTAKSGVTIERTVTLTDTYRSNAVARAMRSAIPQDATNVQLVSAR